MPGATSEPLAVDTQTAADLLGVSKSHLEKLRIENPENSPPYIKVGRCIRYPVESLREWIAEAASQAER